MYILSLMNSIYETLIYLKYNYINTMNISAFAFIHLWFFLTFFVIFAVWEYFFPLREKTSNTRDRWFKNISLSFINTVIIRFLVFVTPLWFALIATENNIWLFNIVELSFFFEIILAVIILDLCIYLQHIASHKWSWFWKFHQIHHSDENLDVTTALRFHFWEMIISLIFKIFLIAVFWFSVVSILVFEILLVVSTMFNHSNIKLSTSLEKLFSRFLVTPTFHQVHHSVIHTQTDSNYWFFLSIWDRIFKTYTPHNFFVKKLWLKYVDKDVSLLRLLLLKVRRK